MDISIFKLKVQIIRSSKKLISLLSFTDLNLLLNDFYFYVSLKFNKCNKSMKYKKLLKFN